MAIRSAMLMALFRVAVLFDVFSAGVGTSKKSHGLSAPRRPPSNASGPRSRESLHPSPSESAAHGLVPHTISELLASPSPSGSALASASHGLRQGRAVS